MLSIMALVLSAACGVNESKESDYSSVSVSDILKKISDEIPTIYWTGMETNEDLFDGIELGNFDDSRTNLVRSEYDCCESGGEIQKYSTTEEAREDIEWMDEYYAGEILDWVTNDHYHEQYDVFVICVSPELDLTQRIELFTAIKNAIEELA